MGVEIDHDLAGGDSDEGGHRPMPEEPPQAEEGEGSVVRPSRRSPARPSIPFTIRQRTTTTALQMKKACRRRIPSIETPSQRSNRGASRR